MQNQVVVFSGFRNEELKKQIEKEGGRVTGAISGATTMLVVDPNGKKSNKPEEARKRGIAVLTLEELHARLAPKREGPSPSKHTLAALEGLPYPELRAIHKQMVEQGQIQMRKNTSMKADAIIKRILAKQTQIMD